MNTPSKCASAGVLSVVTCLGVVQHASYCPYAPTLRAVCFAPPPEHVHGNHNHSPALPSGGFVLVAMSTSTITPSGAVVR
jgi:hypothetical protein